MTVGAGFDPILLLTICCIVGVWFRSFARSFVVGLLAFFVRLSFHCRCGDGSLEEDSERRRESQGKARGKKMRYEWLPLRLQSVILVLIPT